MIAWLRKHRYVLLGGLLGAALYQSAPTVWWWALCISLFALSGFCLWLITQQRETIRNLLETTAKLRTLTQDLLRDNLRLQGISDEAVQAQKRKLEAPESLN